LKGKDVPTIQQTTVNPKFGTHGHDAMIAADAELRQTTIQFLSSMLLKAPMTI